MTLYEISHKELQNLLGKYKPSEDTVVSPPEYKFIQVEQSYPDGRDIEDFTYVFLTDDEKAFKKDVGNSKLKAKEDKGKTEGYFHNIPQDGATWEEILQNQAELLNQAREAKGKE